MTQELPKTYQPEGLEEKWYSTWLEKKCFKPTPGKQKESFTLLMPPPNVTGRLHMGHALDATTQDVLTRYKRMKGFETLFLPGSDHAGIATQSVVEKQLYKEEKKTKHDVGREEFLKKIWDWKEKYGQEIVNQQKKMGVSCDWDYSTFTMDEVPNKAVKKFFVKMYNEGLIYQADYIVNWDPTLQSAISDAEVDHKELKGHFYHILYNVKDSDDVLEIATTRPETLFADTAVAVHPEDERFKHLIGKKAIVPLCQREVEIIADEYVDREKGTGCLKVTPGHDFNDFEIGKRHNLEIITILNKDGTFNELAPLIQGLNTKKARKKTEELLMEAGILKDKKDHLYQVGHGQRSDSIVEPMVSKQWFLNVQDLSQKAVKAVENDEMTFYPKGWENTYFAWLREPKNWCISRQLWWGHQIPVFYCDDCHHQWASETDETSCSNCSSSNIKQDPDVLDTWFSSGLWPLSTLGWPDEKVMEEKKFTTFYPTTTLVTGYDIIFFWVARMMMMGLNLTNQSPFRDVYIHAIVRDKNGKKMSKSLGNGIDPLEMIAQYGADAVRFTLAAGSGYNRNLNLDPARIEGYRNFVNKLWNAFRFIEPHLKLAKTDLPDKGSWHIHDQWILSELNTVTKVMNDSIDEYRFDDACSAIYQFVYDKFCSWYIELSKNILNADNQELKIQRASILKYCFEKIVILLHPITPFITEEIWYYLSQGKDLIIAQDYIEYDKSLENDEVSLLMNKFIEITTSVRNLRQSVNLKPKEMVDIKLFTDDSALAKFVYQSRSFLKDLANVKSGEIKSKKVKRPLRSASSATTHTEVFLPLEGLIDLEEQAKKVQKDIDKTSAEYKKVEAKLSNEKFIGNAPDSVVAEVKEKAHMLGQKLDSLKVILSQYQ